MAAKKVQVTREVFSTRIDPELIRRLKHVAADERKSLNELIEEAIRLLLKSRPK